jgi:HAD superfamily hydrolase (TIGR01509 family)
MLPASPPAAIIFDLDGTLVDTVPARIGAWLAVFEELGIAATRDQIGPMIGMDGVRLALDVARAAGEPVDAERARQIDDRAGELFDELNRDPSPLPGVREALAMLDRSDVTWAIATSSRPAQVSGSVAALGLDHDPRIVDGSSVEHAKPAPDLLLLAANQLAVEPGDAWYVGDSTWDMRAAVAAGMLPIGVLAGAAVDEDALREAGAAVVWGTLEELLEVGWG